MDDAKHSSPNKRKTTAAKITVARVTFGTADVKSAVVTIDGRDIHIAEKSPVEKQIGFGVGSTGSEYGS